MSTSWLVTPCCSLYWELRWCTTLLIALYILYCTCWIVWSIRRSYYMFVFMTSRHIVLVIRWLQHCLKQISSLLLNTVSVYCSVFTSLQLTLCPYIYIYRYGYVSMSTCTKFYPASWKFSANSICCLLVFLFTLWASKWFGL